MSGQAVGRFLAAALGLNRAEAEEGFRVQNLEEAEDCEWEPHQAEEADLLVQAGLALELAPEVRLLAVRLHHLRTVFRNFRRIELHLSANCRNFYKT